MNRKLILIGLGFSPMCLGLLALFWGAYAISPAAVVNSLLSKVLFINSPDAGAELSILWDVRLPRIILSGVVGAALSGAGVTLQGIFRNPLVDPFILGLSAGAAFGCALSVAIFPHIPVQAAAFLFSLAASFGTYILARSQGNVSRLHLVLAGIVVSAFFSALVSILKFLVDPHKLASIVYWLLGSFSLADWPSVGIASIGLAIAGIPLLLMRWRLNALSMGEEEALTLGIPVERERFLFIGAASIAVGSAVSVSGIIGWVGLMVPHLTRMLLGPDHRLLMPFSLALGAAFMIFADTLARNITSFDIPVGIITTLSGTPFFVYLMKRGVGQSWGK
ncbi:MAG: iron ABC transporter permease [Desulfobacteraceae bacterium]|nr:iron ABC transporter permease [Desulfobacteraceae bacterium]